MPGAGSRPLLSLCHFLLLYAACEQAFRSYSAPAETQLSATTLSPWQRGRGATKESGVREKVLLLKLRNSRTKRSGLGARSCRIIRQNPAGIQKIRFHSASSRALIWSPELYEEFGGPGEENGHMGVLLLFGDLISLALAATEKPLRCHCDSVLLLARPTCPPCRGQNCLKVSV